jgi:hypothetical protein
MSITQTVEIPNNRRITLEIPPQITTKTVTLTFTLNETEQKKVPVFGCSKGKYRMAEDFDAPLEDFKDYM